MKDTVSNDRLRGLRIFDITDIIESEVRRQRSDVPWIAHAHSARRSEGSRQCLRLHFRLGGVRSPSELPGCVRSTPGQGSELGAVPHRSHQGSARSSRAGGDRQLAADFQRPHRASASWRIAEDLPRAKAAAARTRAGRYTAVIFGEEQVAAATSSSRLLDSIVKARNGTGRATAADSAALRAASPGNHREDVRRGGRARTGPRPGPSSATTSRVYPAIGWQAAPAEATVCCSTFSDPAHPVRIDAAADSNFSYWHSATFNNDGTKVLFSDEWGGGMQPKCRATDRREWGADAIFTLSGNDMKFKSYYKLPAPQTKVENCVAHNGSLIPIPGRDVMVQAWYQGGISVFDWTDPAHPTEIAFFDRGPVDSTRMAMGGSWSAYWYNGVIVSSEIARGLDIFELVAERVHLAERDRRGEDGALRLLQHAGSAEDRMAAGFALARAYVDQLERSDGLAAGQNSAVRQSLTTAEGAIGKQRKRGLGKR